MGIGHREEGQNGVCQAPTRTRSNYQADPLIYGLRASCLKGPVCETLVAPAADLQGVCTHRAPAPNGSADGPLTAVTALVHMPHPGGMKPHRPRPADFRDVFVAKGWTGTRLHFSTHASTLSRWLTEEGREETLRERQAHRARMRLTAGGDHGDADSQHGRMR